ncbi:MAG: PilZ domain-containing protein [Sphingomicrobium sp.]
MKPPPDRKFAEWPRKSDRVSVEAEVVVRRPSEHNFRVRIYNVSRHGCLVDFISQPRLDERLWVKFRGLEGLEALVCWTEGFTAGVEFLKPLHPGVFDRIVSELA